MAISGFFKVRKELLPKARAFIVETGVESIHINSITRHYFIDQKFNLIRTFILITQRQKNRTLIKLFPISVVK